MLHHRRPQPGCTVRPTQHRSRTSSPVTLVLPLIENVADIKRGLDKIEREKAEARARRDEDASFEHSPFTLPVDLPDISDVFG